MSRGEANAVLVVKDIELVWGFDSDGDGIPDGDEEYEGPDGETVDTDEDYEGDEGGEMSARHGDSIL